MNKWGMKGIVLGLCLRHDGSDDSSYGAGNECGGCSR